MTDETTYSMSCAGSPPRCFVHSSHPALDVVTALLTVSCSPLVFPVPLLVRFGVSLNAGANTLVCDPSASSASLWNIGSTNASPAIDAGITDAACSSVFGQTILTWKMVCVEGQGPFTRFRVCFLLSEIIGPHVHTIS